jgi:NADH:ubiquinone oxidoreductase subunit 5 (subunit L)/multisubunit Na+/H+ antiporter MnhA subunit
VGGEYKTMSTDNQDGLASSTRQDILTLLDSFIYQMQQIRKILLGMSLSAIILAPLAIALSIYLLFHPSFFGVLEIENEFGLVLTVLLGSVLVISGIWLVTGIRQYYSMNQWKKRYEEYRREKEAIDRKIATQFGLDQD